MTEMRLTEWIKTGYPYLKDGIELPIWLLPESSIAGTAEALGDDGILKMSQPIGLDKGIGSLFNSASAPSVPSAEEWQNAVIQWPSRNNVRPIIEALLEVTSRIEGQLKSICIMFDLRMINRSLAVLAFAPFAPAGKPLLQEMAVILGGDVNEPSGLIIDYAERIIGGDILTVEKINECVVRYNAWAKWADTLEKQVISLQYKPGLIAVTPPLSPELVGVLASMIKERQHDESR